MEQSWTGQVDGWRKDGRLQSRGDVWRSSSRIRQLRAIASHTSRILFVSHVSRPTQTLVLAGLSINTVK
jgi:hypothetical protein